MQKTGYFTLTSPQILQKLETEYKNLKQGSFMILFKLCTQKSDIPAERKGMLKSAIL